MALTAPSSTLTGQTIAASYDQVLFLDAAAGVTEATLKIVSGTAGKTALSISDEHVLIKGVDTNNAAGFEVQQTDGTSILKVAASTPAATLIGALTVGVDDAGHDVIFYGNAASSNMTWDTSEDDLVLNDATLSIVQDDAQYGISVDQNTNQKAIYIDHDGVTSESSLYFASPTTTTGTVIRVDDCDALTTGRMMELKSASTDTGTRSLVQITNDEAAATGATCLSIQQDSTGKAISATGGIVEEGGVLKENLLTNSGFDVWSNSTLVNPTTGVAPVCDDAGDLFENGDAGEALTTGWTDNSGGSSSVVIASGGFDFDGSNAYGNLDSDSCQVTAGKLYEIGYDVITAGHVNDECYIGTSAGASNFLVLTGPFITTGTGTGFKMRFTATSSQTVYVRFRTGYSTLLLDNLMFHEVTPSISASGAGASAPDGWIQDGSAVGGQVASRVQENPASKTYTKDGSFYSIKCVSPGSGRNTLAWPQGYGGDDAHTGRFGGKTVTMGAWVWSSDASNAHLFFGTDNANTSQSSGAYHTGGSGWEWLEHTYAVPSDTDFFYAGIMQQGASKTIYISQPMLVFGSSIGEGNYTRPQGEIVWCEATPLIHNNVDPVAADDKVLNLESLSSGMIPKGAMAVRLSGEVENSSITSNQGIRWGKDSSNTEDLEINPSVNAIRQMGSGWVRCDSNGDIYQEVTEAGATLSDLTVKISGVQLR